MPVPALPPDFERLVSSATMNQDPATLCLVDTTGHIVFVNEAWDTFAAENKAPAAVLSHNIVGTRFVDGIHARRVRALFDAFLFEAFGGVGGRTRTVECRGECNSPTETRELLTRFAPIVDPRTRRVAGVLVINQILHRRPIGERYQLRPPDEERYRHASGFVILCCGCRRARVAHDPQTWEMVPGYIEDPSPSTSHGYCPTCLEIYCGADVAQRVREQLAREAADNSL